MTSGAIPEEGAVLQMDHYRFILEEVSDTKIETVVVHILPDETET